MDFSILPELVLLNIGSFLKPKDLLAVSSVCRRVRAVLNTDCVWRRFTDGGLLSQSLDSVNSIVSPTYSSSEGQHSSLEPLCEHRTHFLRQSRLMSNLRRNNFVTYSVPFEDYLADVETINFCSRGQVTYKGSYLFALHYTESAESVVRVFDIRKEPKMIQWFNVNQHVEPPDYHVVIRLQISGDRLVLCQDNFVDVFSLKEVFCQDDCCKILDGHFPNVEVKLLNTCRLTMSSEAECFVMKDLLLVEGESAFQVWDLKSASLVDNIQPKVCEGDQLDFYLCNYNIEMKLVLFSVTSRRRTNICQNVFLFNLNSMVYRDFNPVLPTPLDFHKCFCLCDAHYFVLLCFDESQPMVLVYNISTSLLVKYKIFFEMEEDLKKSCAIINGCLILPTLYEIKLINLKDLEIMRSLWTGFREMIPEIPQFYLKDVTCVNMLNVRHFIACQDSNYHFELWDLENNRMLLNFHECEYFSFNDTFSQIIILSRGFLKVFNFW